MSRRFQYSNYLPISTYSLSARAIVCLPTSSYRLITFAQSCREGQHAAAVSGNYYTRAGWLAQRSVQERERARETDGDGRSGGEERMREMERECEGAGECIEEMERNGNGKRWKWRDENGEMKMER